MLVDFLGSCIALCPQRSALRPSRQEFSKAMCRHPESVWQVIWRQLVATDLSSEIDVSQEIVKYCVSRWLTGDRSLSAAPTHSRLSWRGRRRDIVQLHSSAIFG